MSNENWDWPERADINAARDKLSSALEEMAEVIRNPDPLREVAYDVAKEISTNAWISSTSMRDENGVVNDLFLEINIPDRVFDYDWADDEKLKANRVPLSELVKDISQGHTLSEVSAVLRRHADEIDSLIAEELGSR